MRVRPDDDVYRVNAVWLGPKGLTFPWTARYLAYGSWLLIFCAILAVEAITPLSVGVPPLWEVTISVLVTYGLMGLVDHDRPVKSVAEMLLAEVSAPRADTSRTRARVRPRYKVRERRTTISTERRADEQAEWSAADRAAHTAVARGAREEASATISRERRADEQAPTTVGGGGLDEAEPSGGSPAQGARRGA